MPGTKKSRKKNIADIPPTKGPDKATPADAVEVPQADIEFDAQREKSAVYKISHPDYKDKALGMDETEQLNAAMRVYIDWNKNKAARQDWMDEQDESLKLWKMMRDYKDYPWENCANVAVPVAATAINQFHSRGYDSFFSSRDIITAKVTPASISAINTKLTNAAMAQAQAMIDAGQIPEISPDDLKRNIMRETVALAEIYSRNVGGYLNAKILDDMEEFEGEMDTLLLEVPLKGTGFKKTFWDEDLKRPRSIFIPADKMFMPFTDDRPIASHYIHHYLLTMNEVHQKIKDGVWIDISANMSNDIPNPVFREQVTEDAQEKEPSIQWIEGDQNMRNILEYHGYYDIDGDRIEEPVILTIDYKTFRLLRAEIRTEDKNPKGKEVHHFTKYVFIPIPGSAYGLGMAQLLKPLITIMETMLNQLIDNQTLNNNPWGLIAKNSNLASRGKTGIKPGDLVEIASNEQPLANQIFFPHFQQPSSMTLQIIQLLLDMSKDVSTVSDVLTGQSDKVEAATAILAKIEQSSKVFSVIMKRMFRQANKEITKIYTLYKMHQPDIEFEQLFYMPPEFMDVFRNLEFKVSLRVDPASMNRLQILKKAEILYTTATTNPIIMNDPVKLWNATKIYFQAIGMANEDIRLVLGDTPPAPQPPPDLPQTDEISNLMAGKTMNVLPAQDHMGHMAIIDGFKTDPAQGQSHFATFDRFKKDQLQQHYSEHQAYLYAKQAAAQTLGRQGGPQAPNQMLDEAAAKRQTR